MNREQILEYVRQADNPGDEIVERYVIEYVNSSNLVDIPKYYRFLKLLAPYINIYVELGCCYGWAGLHILYGNPNALVYGIDTRSVLCQEAKDHPNFHFYQGKSTDEDIPHITDIDILLIDSDHTYETTQDELDMWGPRVKSGGLILFDDVYYEEYGCGRVWNAISGNKIGLPDLHPDGWGFGCLIK